MKEKFKVGDIVEYNIKSLFSGDIQIIGYVIDTSVTDAVILIGYYRIIVLREDKKLAELDEKLKTYEALISSTESDVNSSRENLSKDIEKNKKQIAELAAKEASLSEGIDPEIVFKFQRIIQRNRKGIVAVRGNVCDGCHMILPAQFANEVHDGNEILFCPYCSRILFYEESDTNVNTFYSTEEGDLSDLDNGELDDIFGLSDEDSEDQDSEA